MLSAISHFNSLLPLLSRIDQLIERAIALAEVAYGVGVGENPYQGLHIGLEKIQRLLATDPGDLAFQLDVEARELPSAWVEHGSRLAWLRDRFELSEFDVNVVAIALAPELNRRYERLYAYLQDDVRCKRPTVDLVLTLLCGSGAERMVCCAYFAPDAPLIRNHLLHLIPDPSQPQPTLLAHNLKLDDQVVRLLLGREGLDLRLTSWCQLIKPETLLIERFLQSDIRQALLTMVEQSWNNHQSLKLYFCGVSGVGKRQTAEALAGRLGIPLLVADLMRAAIAPEQFEQTLRLVLREAWFQDALLYFNGVDTLFASDRTPAYLQFVHGLEEERGVVILAGEKPWESSNPALSGMVIVPFPMPNFAQRRQYWQLSLTNAGIQLNTVELEGLSDRFRLTPAQIDNAVVTACNRAQWRVAGQTAEPEQPLDATLPTVEDLFAAACAQSGHDLTALARRMEPKYRWGDIVLPADQLAQLREVCDRAKYHQVVYEQWGFDLKLSMGKGLTVLFAGPPGTGKTMAAEVIAHELGLDLYRIDLSQVVSKYIGETEKNLDRIFTSAENANAILLFDEADALFGRRSEVRDAHDRYANIEVGYLLQKMEEYEGVAILATNLRQNLDEAFVRRLAFTVHFPSPDEAQRRQIWAGIFPAKLPLAEDVDLDWLARQFKVSGGNIKNIALAAAFLAAGSGEPVGMAHLLQATRREFQKMGKTLTDAELNGALNRLKPDA